MLPMLKSLIYRVITAKPFLKSVSSLFVMVFFVNSLSLNAQQAEQEESEKPPVKIFDLKMDDEDEAPETPAPASTEQAEVVDDNRTTAEKLEDLKGEVLAVNRDLFILEEDLLFPASTQLAIYFSVDVGQFFSLDNIKVKIDDEQVSHYLYTDKDIKALHRGAIQKLHLDNISTGEHELVAILIGQGPRNREYRKAVSFTFEKGTEAKALEIQLRDDTGKLQPKLSVVEW